MMSMTPMPMPMAFIVEMPVGAAGASLAAQKCDALMVGSAILMIAEPGKGDLDPPPESAACVIGEADERHVSALVVPQP